MFFASCASDLTEDDFNQSADLYQVELTGLDSGLLAAVVRHRATGRTWIQWNGKTSVNYRVEFKDNLEDSTRQNAPGTITPDFALELGATANQRFFRVVESP